MQPPRAVVRAMQLLVGAAGVVGLGFVGVDPATLGLAVAAAALIFCLSVLYRMVRALARPAVEFDLERDAVVVAAGHKHLREERRRLLRAINELKFDHDMGKLSEADYKSVRHGYELRAVEVMRALEAEPELHPDLRRDLASRGLIDGAVVQEAASEPVAESSDETPAAEGHACASCKGINDPDAKFCKHCGKELAA